MGYQYHHPPTQNFSECFPPVMESHFKLTWSTTTSMNDSLLRSANIKNYENHTNIRGLGFLKSSLSGLTIDERLALYAQFV